MTTQNLFNDLFIHAYVPAKAIASSPDDDLEGLDTSFRFHYTIDTRFLVQRQQICIVDALNLMILLSNQYNGTPKGQLIPNQFDVICDLTFRMLARHFKGHWKFCFIFKRFMYSDEHFANIFWDTFGQQDRFTVSAFMALNGEGKHVGTERDDHAVAQIVAHTGMFHITNDAYLSDVDNQSDVILHPVSCLLEKGKALTISYKQPPPLETRKVHFTISG